MGLQFYGFIIVGPYGTILLPSILLLTGIVWLPGRSNQMPLGIIAGGEGKRCFRNKDGWSIE